MSKIEIRKATISDLETIQEISITTFKETFASVNSPENMANYIRDNFNQKQLIMEINNPDSAFYLASLEKVTIGYLKINTGISQTEKQKENSLEIHRIYVLQTFHGKKIGQLLLDEAINSAIQANIDLVWLGVWEENHRALQFYSKNGFVEFDKHIFTLGDDVQTDLLLQLEIKN
ncbi:GNAT family N-acetyltransferase [Flavobacterium cellulosilyticum]|uniref:GNAT family N-acetyltransferase n=1 Tax=Flavobacterium cellulosilyticum TaxID=2541731 RepID=A0A4R5CAK8_9FLAO|nr:GNAT family N-acetyltransferase [Flavobacterium cellulosilyticum]TDD95233.1 GNAT family N-acetyltransferase [Flavobacterium cellulosilyticum]